MQTTFIQTVIVLWINFILVALPPRLIGTYAELLIGAMMSGSGHITEALFHVGHSKHFSTYYWLIEKGKWSWLKVVNKLIKLVVTFFPRKEYNLIVDDFNCPRSSDKAPHAKFHHEHSQKPNRPKYIFGQQWIVLGLSLTWGKLCASLPILPRLHKKVGNSTKLTHAVTMVKYVLPLFRKKGTEVIRCLVDAWYMKAPFILPLLNLGVHVIGQVRKDTVLYDGPPQTEGNKRGRGRPRKYGQQWTEQRVKELPIHNAIITVQGGCKEIKYRTTICLARFLKGIPVIAVWCQYPEQKNWSLILSTDLSLTPERIIKLYARRWKIEPMFNEIKHGYGVAEAWQQTSQALHRWVSMLCVVYSLTRLLSLIMGSEKNDNFVPVIQWRANSVVTAGLVRKGLQFFFRQFTFSQLWNPKSKKLMLPKSSFST
jgi:hypothetical protein